MKRIIPLLFSVLLVSCSGSTESLYPAVTAHRGCWIKDLVPENSLESVRMAARFHYPAVEMDVKYTLDSVMVIMHDKTVNRTMRNASDYSVIAEPVKVASTAFEDLRNAYVFASEDSAQRVQIPTLEEMLLCCRECGIHPVLHSKIPASYDMAQRIIGDDWTAFNADYDVLRYARSISDCEILMDPRLSLEGLELPEGESASKALAAATIARLDSLGGRCGMSTMKYELLDAEYVGAVRAAGYQVQSSIFPMPYDADAIRDGATIMLSNFCWFQSEGLEPEYEYDSSAVGADKLRLGCGGTACFCHSEAEPGLGAVIFDMVIEGKADIVIDDVTFGVDNPEPGRFLVGYRYAAEPLSAVVTAGDGGCTIKRAKASYYRL